MSDIYEIDLENMDPRNESFGTIKHPEDGTPVPYVPYQISRFGLSFFALAGIPLGTILVLESPMGEIQMQVYQAESHGAPEGGTRYNLMCMNMMEDLEQIYGARAGSKGLVTVRHARFHTFQPARIEFRTFGSTHPYPFETINASKSGLLVLSLNKTKAPFNLGTLVEFSIESNDSWQTTEKITGIGRVAHQIIQDKKAEKRLQFYGVEFKEFNDDYKNSWFLAMDQLEKLSIDHYKSLLEKLSPLAHPSPESTDASA